MNEHVELLQTLIRNQCVSIPEPTPGGSERLNLDVLRSVVEGPGIDLEVFEPVEGRPAMVARIEGIDPGAPTLTLLCHTDVVPADPDGWSHDPFGGELINGEVWGRGAVDMLNQTSAMALAFRALADMGVRPRGTLEFVAVPDEECGGRRGMKALIDEFPDAVGTDWVLTEVGGAVDTRSGTPIIEAYVAEKGMMTVIVKIRGIPGHTSVPWGSSNAIVRCAEVVRRLSRYRPPTHISDEWRAWVAAQRFDHELAATLVDPRLLWDILPSLDPDLARTAHACTHTTVVPAIIAGGEKMGTIPDLVTLRVHVRPCVGESHERVLSGLQEELTGLVEPTDVTVASSIAGTRSPRDNVLWPILEQVTQRLHPGSELVPSLLPAQTDARYLRPLGAQVFGFGVLSRRVNRAEYWSRFHGRNERIDTDSLDYSRAAWTAVGEAFADLS
jgi:acetylornithine deacetylase/succinyl-diaminopimelate desuccinylase-like protein